MDSIDDLLKIKRYETPREGYMDDFVKEFHQRQRLAVLEKSKANNFWGLSLQWIREIQVAKWAYALGISYACLMAWLLITPSADSTVRGYSAVPVNYPVPTPAAPKLTPEQQAKELQKAKSAVVDPF